MKNLLSKISKPMTIAFLTSSLVFSSLKESFSQESNKEQTEGKKSKISWSPPLTVEREQTVQGTLKTSKPLIHVEVVRSTPVLRRGQEKYLKNSVGVSGGIQSWGDAVIKDIYGEIFIFKGNYLRKLNEKIDIELSAEMGSGKRAYQEDNVLLIGESGILEDNIATEYNLLYRAINFGLRGNVFTSDDEKTKIHVNAGLKYAFLWNTIHEDFEKLDYYDNIEASGGSTVGYYLGAEIETRIRKNLDVFMGTTRNKREIILHGKKRDIGGIQVTIGLKYNFNLSKK